MTAVKPDESGQRRRRCCETQDRRRRGHLVKQAGPGKLTITDAKGDVAMVTIADVLQSNGVIHVIDTVLLP